MSSHENSYEEEDDEFIKVAKNEEEDFMEFPKEEDGTVLLRTIQTQFSDAIGLKYKGSSGAWRAVRDVDNALVAPKGGWGDQVYILTFSENKKRKGDSVNNDEKDAKYTRTTIGSFVDFSKDLAIIGLPFSATDSEVKALYEEKYGEVVKCQVKIDGQTGKSRGFGFIRFKDEEAAKAALNDENYMSGRRVVLRPKREKPMKMYVGNLPEDTTREELVEYFSKFGRVIDSYLPTPFKRFAFFTFSSDQDGRNCLREEHIFRDTTLKVRVRQEQGQQQAGGNDAGHGGFRNQGNGYQPSGYQSTGYQPSGYQPSGYQSSGYQAYGNQAGGYNSRYKPGNNQQKFHGRNMPSQALLSAPSQPLLNAPSQALLNVPPTTNGQPQAKNNKAAELKSMLLNFLTS